MNKQELIDKYENKLKDVQLKFGANFKTKVYEDLLEDLKQLDEPKEKATLPRPVANWISCVRGRNKTLHFALENAPEEVNLWFCEDEKNRQKMFADAWVNGYHIEKEKRYLVKMKKIDSDSAYLKHELQNNHWYWGTLTECGAFSPYHTKKELKGAGFGEVFDSSLFEVDEVEE